MKKGFTLLETMVVALIISVIIGALFQVLSTGRVSWSSADTQITLQQDLRRASEEIAGDLHKSGITRVSCPADGVTYTAISFNTSQGALSTGVVNWSSVPINYSLSGGQIIRDEGAESRVVANNITSLGFTRGATTPEIVTVSLTAQRSNPYGRTFNASLNTTALLRN